MQGFKHVENNLDAAGNPAGGKVIGVGVSIDWQIGPLVRDEDRTEPNGAFVEDVIEAARQRIAYYQEGKFACEENAVALEKLAQALEALDSRTKDREKREVEGTHVA